ncbi:D-2-hydroxyacid dehydrogenase family protein [Paracoccus aestuarii]|uniref:D-2-hydroxyacid dehydrogenase family protein n=1 Tax=Paracoccus aestuarii TaxID=453842 RepID=A0A418ZZE8_9RHOB|nr:D-2-hydroxyacid dehydrogenase family protein [Paracoccus aestuarii]RJL05956.1 D-2-hydroxyacid dehydrogenase family protein [Paracoccus aestuarii]WCQ98428.1 D-2-hydroxyacid dehydrogenase family protein [Paracoccus aestuarii]
MRIAVLDDYADAARRLADWPADCTVTVFHDTLSDPEALIRRLRPFDIICVMRERTPLTGDIIRALPDLRLIVTTGARNLSIDVAAAEARGIPVCGTESRGSVTAEFVMTAILALSRRILPEANAAAAGHWQQGLGRDLSGLTLGIAGYGRIGRRLADLARPFGMEILAWSRSLTADRAAAEGLRHAATLDEVMAGADVLSVNLVLSDQTRGLIGARELALMRPDALIVNAARGPIVQTAPLLEALHARRLGGAALDVHDIEPLPAGAPVLDPALIADGRLLVTPHLGYVSEQTFRLFYRQTVEAIEAWRAGRPIRVIAVGRQATPST